MEVLALNSVYSLCRESSHISSSQNFFLFILSSLYKWLIYFNFILMKFVGNKMMQCVGCLQQFSQSLCMK
jgi:hypothetical protein